MNLGRPNQRGTWRLISRFAVSRIKGFIMDQGAGFMKREVTKWIWTSDPEGHVATDQQIRCFMD
jgi:hypothetical protein